VTEQAGEPGRDSPDRAGSASRPAAANGSHQHHHQPADGGESHPASDGAASHRSSGGGRSRGPSEGGQSRVSAEGRDRAAGHQSPQRHESAPRRESAPGRQQPQGRPFGIDLAGEVQRWLIRSGARSMRREFGEQVRRTLGGSRPEPGDVWGAATSEPPPDELFQTPECAWCPICRAARRVRESGPGLGSQLAGAGDAVAAAVQEALSAFDAVLSTGSAPAPPKRPTANSGPAAAGPPDAGPASSAGAGPAGPAGPAGAAGAARSGGSGGHAQSESPAAAGSEEGPAGEPDNRR
jgi:hypothetical protein